MKLIRKVGATSQIWQVFIADSSSTTGAGLTGLTNASGSLTAYYHRDTDTTATAISLVTMTVGTFTSSGFKEIDATNMPGWYQFCPPNAALASGAASCGFHLKGATNMAPLPIEVDLDAQVDVTFWNGTVVATPATAGIPDVNVKNMNNVAATSITTINANLGTTQPQNFTGTAGAALVKVDVIDWNSTAVAVPATAGVVEVNVKNINNVSAASVTTVSANQGTTQPVNFTGAGASALAKSDMVDIAGAAVSTTTAQIGVNAVNIGGTAQTGRDLGASVLLSSGTGTGQVSLSAGTVTVGTNNDKTGYALTGAGNNSVADALLDRADAIETSLTPRLAWRYAAGATAGIVAGAGTSTVTIQGAGVGTTRITATVDANGNRSAVTLS